MDLLPPSPPTRGGGLRLKNQTTERAGCYLPAQGPVWPFSFTARIRRRFPGTLPHGQQPLTEKRRPCNGSANEIWVHKSNGEYVLKANGSSLCLDDPAYSTANGTQLIVYTCSGTRNQRWSLP